VFNDQPNKFVGGRGGPRHPVSSWYDVGVQMSPKGDVADVRQDSAAWNAGLAPGMSVVAINGRAFDSDLWTAAITGAKGSSDPIHLLVKDGGWYSTIDVAYHDGLKIPHLERIAGTTDMLAQIMAPHVAASPSAHR
jgi:predicted metalloprotease with PDZ domain